MREPAAIAFGRAVTRLNGKNLIDLWATSCLFSCIEYFDSWTYAHNFLFPTIHAEKIALLHRAILESASSEYKTSTLTSRDVPYVFNAVNDSTTARITWLEGNEDPNVRIRRMLATMAHQQIRLQEASFLDRFGRVYAMLHEIPVQFREELQGRLRSSFIDLPLVVPNHIGLTVKDFLRIGFGFITLMNKRYEETITISENTRQYTTADQQGYTRKQAEVICRTVDEAKQTHKNLMFTAKDLVVPGSSIFTLEKIQTYLDLLSKTTRQLRELLHSESVYTEGLIPDRLSPLERFPIILLPDQKYIIPNLRHFDNAVTEVLHFILQGIYPSNDYNQLRGYIQEIFLRLLVQDRLKSTTIIPEISYNRSRNRVEGSDLTIIDNDRKALIVLESKAKRMRVISRVNPASPSLVEDLKGAIGAFEKLPGKIGDLYAELPEYLPWQDELNSTKDSIPIAVVVIGEGLYFINEILNDHLRDNPNHFLNSFPIPYCLMRIEVFEKSVEIAAHTGQPLYQLLHEYWLGSQSDNISEASAESFQAYPISDEKRFTHKYADLLFETITE